MTNLCGTLLPDAIERIRQDPRVQDFINRVTSMQPSDYFLPPSEWQGRLVLYINQIESALEQASGRPELRYVRDWLIKAVQDVSASCVPPVLLSTFLAR